MSVGWLIRVSLGRLCLAGSAAAPTAPSGKVCLYLYSNSSVDGVNGWANYVAPTDGSYVNLLADGITGSMQLSFSWAYTAP